MFFPFFCGVGRGWFVLVFLILFCLVLNLEVFLFCLFAFYFVFVHLGYCGLVGVFLFGKMKEDEA